MSIKTLLFVLLCIHQIYSSTLGIAVGNNRTHSCVFTTNNYKTWEAKYHRKQENDVWKAAFTSPMHSFIVNSSRNIPSILKTENVGLAWNVVFNGKPNHEIHLLKFLNHKFGYALASYTVRHGRDGGESEHKYFYILITENAGNSWTRKWNLPVNCYSYSDILFVKENEVVLIGRCLHKGGAASTGTILTSSDLIKWDTSPVYLRDQVTNLKKIDYFAPFTYIYGESSMGHFVYTKENIQMRTIPLSAEYNSPTKAVGWMGCEVNIGHVKCYWSYSQNGEDFIPSNDGNPLESPYLVGSNQHGFWILGSYRSQNRGGTSKIYFSRDGIEFEEQEVSGNEHTCIPLSISLHKN